MSRRQAGNLLLAVLIGLIVIALAVMTWRGFDGLLLGLCGVGLAMGGSAFGGHAKSREGPPSRWLERPLTALGTRRQQRSFATHGRSGSRRAWSPVCVPRVSPRAREFRQPSREIAAVLSDVRLRLRVARWRGSDAVAVLVGASAGHFSV